MKARVKPSFENKVGQQIGRKEVLVLKIKLGFVYVLGTRGHFKRCQGKKRRLISCYMLIFRLRGGYLKM